MVNEAVCYFLLENEIIPWINYNYRHCFLDEFCDTRLRKKREEKKDLNKKRVFQLTN